MTQSAAKSVRHRPPLFRALGAGEPPQTVYVAGRPYRHIDTFKHDSWAATALYRSDEGDGIVCKFNRAQPIFILPMSWLGRRLARRENGLLKRLAAVAGAPD